MPNAFTREELTAASTTRFSEGRVVRFQDVDAAGIVFYPRILEYFSDAYIAMLLAAGFDLPGALKRGEVLMPLVHAEGDFVAPMRFGDAITVEVVAARPGETSFTVGYRVRGAGGKVAAVGQTVHVCLDRATFTPGPIPEGIRAILRGGAAG